MRRILSNFKMSCFDITNNNIFGTHGSKFYWLSTLKSQVSVNHVSNNYFVFWCCRFVDQSEIFSRKFQKQKEIDIFISKILPSVIFILSAINLIKWPIKSRDSWIESTIGYYDWTLAQSDDAQDKNHTRQDLRYF